MASIYKLIEKEKESDLYGLENTVGEKRKRLRPWEKSELEEEEADKKSKRVKKK